jgi:hypothetical protein
MDARRLSPWPSGISFPGDAPHPAGHVSNVLWGYGHEETTPHVMVGLKPRERARDAAPDASRLVPGKASEEKPAENRATRRRRQKSEQPVGPRTLLTDPERRATRAVVGQEQRLMFALLLANHQPGPEDREGVPFRRARAASALRLVVDGTRVVGLRGCRRARAVGVSRTGLRLRTAITAPGGSEHRLQRCRNDQCHQGNRRYG